MLVMREVGVLVGDSVGELVVGDTVGAGVGDPVEIEPVMTRAIATAENVAGDIMLSLIARTSSVIVENCSVIGNEESRV